MAEVVPTVLLDSVIMIDHFNAVPAATSYLSEMQGKLAISVITRAEVLAGFEGKDRRLTLQLLDRFPLLIINRAIADIAATLRRQNRWKMPDALQAAVARHHKLTLATRDTDDFPPKRYRFVIVPTGSETRNREIEGRTVTFWRPSDSSFIGTLSPPNCRFEFATNSYRKKMMKQSLESTIRPLFLSF